MKVNWKKYEKYDYYTPKIHNFTKYALLSLLAIFFLIVTSFALVEVNNFYNDQPLVLKMFSNSFKSSQEQEALIKNEKLYSSERQTRAANEANTTATTPKSKTYYEEQTPVVVYSKTDTNPSIAFKQMSEIPPRQDNDEEDPYRNAPKEEDYMGNDDDYFGQPETNNQKAPAAYYRQLQQQQQQVPQPYYRQLPPPTYYRQQQQQQQPPQPYYRQLPNPQSPYNQSPYYRSPPNPQYYDDSREDFPSPDSDKQTSEESRANQYRDYTNYYRQQPYATPPPVAGNNKRLQGPNNNENRKMQTAAKAQQQQQNRDPYPSYMDDYDYMSSPQSRQPLPPQHPYSNRPVPAQSPQYRHPNTAIASAEQKQESGQQMDILSIIKSLKTMWDIYQSFTSSWSSIAEKRNREDEIAKQKYKQMEQIRINSKKPPKFNNKRNSTMPNKGGRKTTTTTTTVAPESAELNSSAEEQMQSVKKQPTAKVEPRKGSKGDKASGRDVEGLRDKRQASEGSSDVGEGRYIKGDPLKGYYDFVITEGSYKFWAAFQVGTAILIIYSTFAAIYYSKVNPLVSDYDYTDYLGGARSLSGGDLDFVDDDLGVEQKAQPKSWLEWLPRTGHSLKFVLDAIDKLPVDHEMEYSKTEETLKEQESSETNENDYEGEEYSDNTETENEQTQTKAEEEHEQQTNDVKETQRIDDREDSKELQNSNETKQAM